MIKIRFTVRPFLKSNNQVAIRVRWNNKESEVTFITGVYAVKEKWDDELHRAMKGTTHIVRRMRFSFNEINQRIAEFKEEIENAFSLFASRNTIPTAQELKDRVNSELGRKKEETQAVVKATKSVYELLQDFLSEYGRERNWDYQDKAKYIQAYTQLTSAVPSISPHNIDKETMFALRDWFVKKKYKNRTINKQLIMLKCFFKWINKQEGYSIPQEVLEFSTNLKVLKKTVTFMHYDELRMFTDIKLSTPRLERARDMWCFMAYTSLRYSDLRRLNRAHINGNCISMLAEKTDGQLLIPLTEGALKIMSRYEDGPNGEIFPVVTNQQLNDAIKEAAKEAQIDRIIIDTYYIGQKKIEKPQRFCDIISCHDARRTFVSCSLAMGIPGQVVMKCTGHTNYNTMKPYIETASETQCLEMEKWNRSQHRSQIIELLEKANEKQLVQVLDFVRKLKLS